MLEECARIGSVNGLLSQRATIPFLRDGALPTWTTNLEPHSSCSAVAGTMASMSTMMGIARSLAALGRGGLIPGLSNCSAAPLLGAWGHSRVQVCCLGSLGV